METTRQYMCPLAQVISTDVESKLIDLMASHEEWLMERILCYANQHGYAKYTSTLKEAWRLSISGLTESLTGAISANKKKFELHPDEDYQSDPAATFGIKEARLHRQRGVPLSMFLGLMKYYRQSYMDLVNESENCDESKKLYTRILDRLIDRIEIAFCTEWAVSRPAHLKELQHTNREMTNEKNKYLTIFESIPHPVILLTSDLKIDNLNFSATRLFKSKNFPGFQYYASLENKNGKEIPLSGKHLRENPLIVWIKEEIRAFIKSARQYEYFEKKGVFDSKKHLFGVKLSKMVDVSNKYTGTVIMLQDLTEMKHTEEALRINNIELETQTNALKTSKILLTEKQKELKKRNEELESIHQLIEEKAESLELTNQYKTEFLTNISHELRTPLNSILLLSGHLGENTEGRLSDDDIKSAKSIYDSGRELLELINEILDLSKAESGKTQPLMGWVNLNDFISSTKAKFAPLAEQKSLEFIVEKDGGLPETLYTDYQFLDRIIKNFISNAIKFTESGYVSLLITFNGDKKSTSPPDSVVDAAHTIHFTVKDTGIGIKDEQQKLIFEAFQQSDGSISRKYGGTGLGLAISKKLAGLLEGEICCKSTYGEGSIFTLTIPIKTNKQMLSNQPVENPRKETNQWKALASDTSVRGKSFGRNKTMTVMDDRKNLSPDDKSLLIVEKEMDVIKVLHERAHGSGFKTIFTRDCEESLEYISRYNPSAILLSLHSVGSDGWSVLCKIKENGKTRHIPVGIISSKESTLEVMKTGAIFSFFPGASDKVVDQMLGKLDSIISKPVKDLLVVEDEPIQQKLVARILKNDDIQIHFSETALGAYEKIRTNTFDCVILDLGLPDMSGFELLDKVDKELEEGEINPTPIIVYTGRELTRDEKVTLDEHARCTILKNVDSHRKLLYETTLFLHLREDRLPIAQKEMLKLMQNQKHVFANKKLLMADDDMRNVFSLRRILKEKGFEIFIGKNGLEALDILDQHPDMDIVLMDIMMPEMDGMEAMKKIREQEAFSHLPIIALTAKAMREDRKKCIQAGASDYVVKPINVDRLFSLLRTWLY